MTMTMTMMVRMMLILMEVVMLVKRPKFGDDDGEKGRSARWGQ